MPLLALPEITLPAPLAVPPMMLAGAFDIATPENPFATAVLPVASVPMKLPSHHIIARGPAVNEHAVLGIA